MQLTHNGSLPNTRLANEHLEDEEKIVIARFKNMHT